MHQGGAALIHFEYSGVNLGVEEEESGENKGRMDRETDDRAGDIIASSHSSLFTSSDSKAGQSPLCCVGEIHV